MELAALFLRLGCTAFGGPAAHIALMQAEVVERRRWLSSTEFLDRVSAANLIPGPNSTELAIHIGYERAGWPGLFVAGACFIVPSAASTLGIAWFYVRFGALPQVPGLLHGIKPVIIAVVVQALLGLGRTVLAPTLHKVLVAIAVSAALAGVAELGVLAGTGVLAMAARGSLPTRPKAPMLALGTGLGATAVASGAATPSSLFLVFAKIGSLLFGSGYVLLAFLRSELVVDRHWLTEAQLVDAVAAGQITPGPVFTTATFVGYVLGGAAGAGAATAGIFAPAFLFVAASGFLVPRLRASPRANAFLDGVNVASFALMAVVAVQLGRTSLVDPVAVLLGVGSLVALLRWKVNSVWLILAGGAVGLLVGSR